MVTCLLSSPGAGAEAEVSDEPFTFSVTHMHRACGSSARQAPLAELTIETLLYLSAKALRGRRSSKCFIAQLSHGTNPTAYLPPDLAMWDGEKSRSGPEIFPAVPVLCIISIICCLLLVPGFMKTRVFALTFYVWWLILGSTLILVNTCIWRGNTRNIPIYADIVAHIWGIYCLTLYAAMLCVNKLIWTISRPAPSVKVYDSRLRMNRIDILVCVGLPLLLSPVYAVTSFGRYTITEDFGPWALFSVSLDTWILQNLPITLITIISITYSYRSFRNFYRSRRSKRILDIEPNHLFQHRALSDIQVVRYCSATLVSILGMTFGVIWLNMDWIYWAINDPDKVKWYSQLVLLNNWQYRDQVYQQTRTEMENDNPMFSTLLKGTVFYFSIPSSGIQIFLWFGLGAEARKSYFHWLSSLVELITRTRAYIWLEALFVMIKWRIRPHQMDPENFTPFQLDDVRLEELSTTTIWSDSDTTLESVLPPYPIARLSRPYMSKNSRRVNAQTVSIRIPPPSVLRKESVQRQHARGRNSQLQSIL